MIIAKTILTLSLLFVFFQDTKERMVYWFLFPIIGLLNGFLFYKSTLSELFFMSIKMNVIFILIFVVVILLYAKYKLKTPVFNTIGLGDVLLFFALSLSFSTMAFVVIFISALIFSLLLHLLLSKNKKTLTVPLAGYMSLFFLATYFGHWSGYVDVLYTL
ncbi:hypothetical protein [Changchengzhania lutea]|uniref:hypothetical protein n=1 Tax=Changchengzhania lutea TaxID=2049305 RepID=UPI00115C4B07|nr:hypothetical protein [Changchengzhania lutea]